MAELLFWLGGMAFTLMLFLVINRFTGWVTRWEVQHMEIDELCMPALALLIWPVTLVVALVAGTIRFFLWMFSPNS